MKIIFSYRVKYYFRDRYTRRNIFFFVFSIKKVSIDVSFNRY